MSFWRRWLRQWGYVRIRDYGLIVTEAGQVIRVSDGVVVNGSAPPAAPQLALPPASGDGRYLAPSTAQQPFEHRPLPTPTPEPTTIEPAVALPAPAFAPAKLPLRAEPEPEPETMPGPRLPLPRSEPPFERPTQNLRKVTPPQATPPILTPPPPGLSPPRAIDNRRTATGTQPPPVPKAALDDLLSEPTGEDTVTDHEPEVNEPPVAVRALPRLTGRVRIPPRPETEASEVSEVSEVSELRDAGERAKTTETTGITASPARITASSPRVSKSPAKTIASPDKTTESLAFDDQQGDATVVDRPRPERAPLPRLSARLAARRRDN